jgi:hypothetical protein
MMSAEAEEAHRTALQRELQKSKQLEQEMLALKKEADEVTGLRSSISSLESVNATKGQALEQGMVTYITVPGACD